MDGLNQSVRKVPDTTKMMKVYSAISPSKNDQWSGKILRRFVFSHVFAVIRWSTKSTTLPAPSTRVLITLPVTRAHRLGEVARCDQIPLGVDHQRQLWKVPCRRAEDEPAVVGQVEGGVVARAQEVVGVLFVQADRASHVSTH